MTLILSGSNGVSDIDGSASTPAIRGTDANTGIFFGADIIGFAEGGAECARFNADAQFVAAAGTASLPVITTTGDLNTGIFFPAADTIAFAEGGAEAMRIDSSGNLLVGTTTAQQKLTVSGQLSLKNSQNLAVINTGDTASVLNNGTLTLTGLNQSGLLVINNNVDQIALYLCSATGSPFTTEISDPSGVYSTASGTASNTNVYFSGGVLTLENKTGSTRIYRILYLTS
jgi:hypothetical protein